MTFNTTLRVPEKKYPVQQRKYLGIFVILSSDHKAEALDTLFLNRKRDAVEKIFDILKNSTV